ncbi:MAG TPA: mycofactocin precursor MftA [Solirubrobacteraceae bacterium]|jgi:mycofactocin precursor|nr:mycofactocin precursor MftA [Solirubrobacteraceae bacterium]
MPQSDTEIVDALPRTGATPAPIETATAPPAEPRDRPADDLVQDDLLVEDVSIDGMCGVY